MSRQQTTEILVEGMTCGGCGREVQQAIAALQGIETVNVFVTSQKAVVRFDQEQVDLTRIHNAIQEAGFGVSIPVTAQASKLSEPTGLFTRKVLALFGIVFAVVLFVVVMGEWLGLFEAITHRVPWFVGWAIVLGVGYPIFRNVVRSALKRRITSHTLMSAGVFAALLVGEWATAAIVLFFMYVGDYAETFTTERARRALKDLTKMAPQTARVERKGIEQEIPVTEVRVGEKVIVRPGERIPVDGEVLSGQATVDQATITGESLPIEIGAGDKVFAATLASLGSLRIRTTHTGSDTTFGRVIKLVEEAETHRAEVQRIADKFSAYYLPAVLGIAAFTFAVRRDPLATAAVLVVACSCSFALATPVAMLASVGASAKRGLLIKGVSNDNEDSG